MKNLERNMRSVHLALMGLILVGMAAGTAACKTTNSSGKSNSSSGNDAMKPLPRERPLARPTAKPTAKPFGHAAYDALLKKYVDVQGRVAYQRWMKAVEDTKGLTAYLGRLAKADPTGLTRDGQKAFWINAYNAHVLRGVMDKLAANAKFSVGDSGFVFFDEVRYPTAGQTLSLNEIENGILRGDWGHKSLKKTPAPRLTQIKQWNAGVGKVDPRVHFALVCASLGCPNLRASAFTGKALETQLEKDTVAYINNPAKGAGPKGISALFSWFKKDFQAAGLPPKKFIAKYYKSNPTQVLHTKQLPYSWKLNQQ
jgi:hypothetical protein